MSAAVTLLSAYAWPTALQKGYQLAWQLPSRGLRDVWRPLLWLAALLGAVALFVVLGGIRHGGPLPVLVSVLVAPGVFLWAWWTQHLLLGGRVGWRPLLVGALLMTVGLYALRTGAQLSLSSSITYNYDRYGPIGIVFVLISWFIGFGVVMLGGAVVGAELWEARLHRAAAAAERASAEKTSEARTSEERTSRCRQRRRSGQRPRRRLTLRRRRGPEAAAGCHPREPSPAGPAPGRGPRRCAWPR